MIEPPADQSNTNPPKLVENGKKRWPEKGMRVFFTVIGCVAIVIILISFVYDKTSEQVSFATVNILALLAFAVVIISAVTARMQWEVMDRQEFEMTEQRKAMQGQLRAMHEEQDLMQRQLEQTDKMFYMANRAYIGVKHIEIFNPVTNKSEFPDSGKFRVDYTVVNKGKTPALDFGHVFRGCFVSAVADPWPTLPDFDEIAGDRVASQILPEEMETIRGDTVECSPYEVALIKTDRLLFVVSCKFVFNCLGQQNETYITYHIWDPHSKGFFERKDWPPKTGKTNNEEK
jgi:hypothetical protein